VISVSAVTPLNLTIAGFTARENPGPESGHSSWSSGETLGANWELPLKLPRKLWDPLPGSGMVRMAIPAGSVMVFPRITPPSRKTTVDCGEPCPAATVTCKARVPSSGCSVADNAAKVGMALDGADCTTSGTAGDELPANVAFALKIAEMLCVPMLNEAVLKLAVPSA